VRQRAFRGLSRETAPAYSPPERHRICLLGPSPWTSIFCHGPGASSGLHSPNMRTKSTYSVAIARTPASGLIVFRLALAPVCALAQQQALGASSTNTGLELEEVVVAAQKRTERLQDVPVPVTAVTADALLDQNELRAQDFFSSVPGLDLAATPGAWISS
jgi:hypothetical protein